MTMKRIIAIFAAILLSGWWISAKEPMKDLTDRVFSVAVKQFVFTDGITTEGMMPGTASKSEPRPSKVSSWTAGFFPGSLWYTYLYTKDERIRNLAVKYTELMYPESQKARSHDIGFQINCSYGNALRITGDQRWREPVITASRCLAKRFNPAVGATRSWNFSAKGKDWKFPVIIDNMMNLELLLEGATLSGEDSLKNIAITHARTTASNHFRPDYSTYHVVDYDPEDGHVRERCTHQGYSDSSAWGRGQAWGLYGFTMMYEKTGLLEFLSQAENIAGMLLERLPEDGIPYWDFDAPEIPDEHRDASAGAIMCSAFIKLSGLTYNKALARQCRKMAEVQLRTLASPAYLALPGENAGFLLYHSVANMPKMHSVDAPLPYADYYFLEALLRWNNML